MKNYLITIKDSSTAYNEQGHDIYEAAENFAEWYDETGAVQEAGQLVIEIHEEGKEKIHNLTISAYVTVRYSAEDL